jgi:hypothetical protein
MSVQHACRRRVASDICQASIVGCPHLALLGNYRAREDGELGMDIVKGRAGAYQSFLFSSTGSSFVP